MNYVKLTFGQEFQWPKIMSFLANKSCIKCDDSAMIVVNTKEINKKLKMRYLKPIFITMAFQQKFAIILS